MNILRSRHIIYLAVCLMASFVVSLNAHSFSKKMNYSDAYEDTIDTGDVDTIDTVDFSNAETFNIDSIGADGTIYAAGKTFSLLGDMKFYNPDFDEDYAVKSVAGVEFGTKRYSAIEKFKSRFGYSYTDNGTYVTFREPSIGGNDFSYAEFYFKGDTFCAACLTRLFELSDFNKAKAFRDRLATQYGNKYENIKSRIDKAGFKYYLCGMVENGRYPIWIGIEKSQSKGGKTYYYVSISYYDFEVSLKSDI